MNQLTDAVVYGTAGTKEELAILESVLRHGGEVNLILPYPAKLYCNRHICSDEESEWTRRFEQIVQKAARVEVLSQNTPTSFQLSEAFAHRYAYGLSRYRSKLLKTEQSQ